MGDEEKRGSEITKEEMLLKMQERLNAPLEWPSIESCKILDLQPQHYDETLRLIKRHFFNDDPMCRSAGLTDDSESIECYLEYIRVWMRDTTSLVAISSKSQRVVGVAITRPNNEEDQSITYSRMQIYEGEVLKKIMDFRNTLVKRGNPHEYFNQPELFQIYVLCVHPSYQPSGLETSLLEAIIEMAIALEIPAVVGLFTSGISQRLAEILGFEVLAEIRYTRWFIDDKVVFNNPGIGNYTAAFMGMLTPSLDHMENIRRERRALKREEERRKKKH